MESWISIIENNNYLPTWLQCGVIVWLAVNFGNNWVQSSQFSFFFNRWRMSPLFQPLPLQPKSSSHFIFHIQLVLCRHAVESASDSLISEERKCNSRRVRIKGNWTWKLTIVTVRRIRTTVSSNKRYFPTIGQFSH